MRYVTLFLTSLILAACNQVLITGSDQSALDKELILAEKGSLGGTECC